MCPPSVVLPDNLELFPGRIPEIDEETRATLAKLILDETVELPSSERGNQIMYGHLTDEEFINLFRPLVEVLQLDPSKDHPPLREHIKRASKLGLTPSATPIYNRMSLSDIHTGLGFRAKFRFNDWMLNDFVKSGQRLARFVGGRPTREIITAAGRGDIKRLRGDFPTVDDIKSRFGKLSVWHELIGYPSCKGWIEDDYIDWASAFYRQNTNQELSARIIDGFSAMGRGPSKQPIIKIFGSIAKFKDLSQIEFENSDQIQTQEQQQRFADTEGLARVDEDLLDALTDTKGDKTRILQISAQYQIARGLNLQVQPRELKDAARIKTPDSFVRWCMHRSEGIVSAATVETQASLIGVFDDLWPMYRFQNVDLALPEAA